MACLSDADAASEILSSGRLVGGVEWVGAAEAVMEGERALAAPPTLILDSSEDEVDDDDDDEDADDSVDDWLDGARLALCLAIFL